MELEKQRGISVSSTVLQFEYGGCVINLLDTPGHKDFSEDTYRVLTAVDAAVMVIDAGKGIEAQTRKLFEVCRLRGVPIFTFMNKMDRPSRPAARTARRTRIRARHSRACRSIGRWATARNSAASTIARHKQVHSSNARRSAPIARRSPSAASRTTRARDDGRRAFTRASARNCRCSKAPAPTFDLAAVQAGKLTPVFFGSAAQQFRRPASARSLSAARAATCAAQICGEGIVAADRAGVSPASSSRFRRT